MEDEEAVWCVLGGKCPATSLFALRANTRRPPQAPTPPAPSPQGRGGFLRGDFVPPRPPKCARMGAFPRGDAWLAVCFALFASIFASMASKAGAFDAK